MLIHGKHLIAGAPAAAGPETFTATSPLGLELTPSVFAEAGEAEVDAALQEAAKAAPALRNAAPEARAVFLEAIATEILELGDALLERAHAESGLPMDRLTGERGRTVGQLRQFAAVLREGSWCDARIDTALPERQPLPRPDLRRVLVPLGPVVVFGASNFPLAFSVAGGDTASALAAGCPVVVKGHPAHPGTGELVASAVSRAAGACGLPGGVFSFLQGACHGLGAALVSHPLVKAVGFTGSHRGGRALLDAASRRPEPIPVFAEMSSLNPVFLLPGALAERGAQIAEGLKGSMTMGVGQFCTKPGLVFAMQGGPFEAFLEALEGAVASAGAGTMLHGGIAKAYEAGVEAAAAVEGVRLLVRGSVPQSPLGTPGRPAVLTTDAATFLSRSVLREEIFGPATLVVKVRDNAEMLEVARKLEGQLTATVHGNAGDLENAGALFSLLEQKAGRLLVNGFPTGVEVSAAMQHGGPYPATTDSRFTSVGTAAIQRWARPVCFQNFPAAALPAELQNANVLNLMRLVNGVLTRDAVA
jgi:NADP-dependent aldehyde dehydrogenase